MKHIFNKSVDYFIHPRLKLDKSLYEKSKISTLAFIIVLFMGVFYVTYYIINGCWFDIKALHNYIGLSVSLIGLGIIKKIGNTDLALAIGALMGAYLVTASTYLSGGINSNDILWYTVLSAASFMFINITTGFVVFGFSLIATALFYFLEIYGLIHFDADTVSMSLSYKYFNYVLILAVLTFMVYVLVKGNKKLQEIVQLNKEQKIREEIARDFHDQIGNKLASLRHLTELVTISKTEEGKQQILSKIDVNAKDVYDNFRDFIWTLDAKSDRLDELFMYLRDFADDYFKFSDVNMFINSSPDQLPDSILPSYYSKEIMPLFKEAITNVYKHAQAKNIYLDFHVSKTTLTIKLKDDGVGVDESVVSKGNGLVNMKHRAKKTGGKLEIVSALNNGTEVVYEVLLPIKGS